MQLDVRLLELLDRRRHRRVDGRRRAERAPRVLPSPCASSRSRRARSASSRKPLRVGVWLTRDSSSASRRPYSSWTRCVTSSSVRTASSRAWRSRNRR
jgi:hypothetical protein